LRLPQLCAGIQSQFLGEAPSYSFVHLQRIDLASSLMQTGHQLRCQTFAQGVQAERLPQARHGFRRPPDTA
jgi:hypothetical protein